MAAETTFSTNHCNAKDDCDTNLIYCNFTFFYFILLFADFGQLAALGEEEALDPHSASTLASICNPLIMEPQKVKVRVSVSSCLQARHQAALLCRQRLPLLLATSRSC